MSAPGHKIAPCPTCYGEGVVEHSSLSEYERLGVVKVRVAACQDCYGTGRAVLRAVECERCDGTGQAARGWMRATRMDPGYPVCFSPCESCAGTGTEWLIDDELTRYLHRGADGEALSADLEAQLQESIERLKAGETMAELARAIR